jgi:hypothetical protein
MVKEGTKGRRLSDAEGERKATKKEGKVEKKVTCWLV